LSLFVTTCRFNATSTGTGAFVVASAVSGHVTPDNATAVDGRVYHYYAESPDGTQWEDGSGAYTKSSHTLARTTINSNSAGSTVPISFSAVPIVDVFPSPTLLESAPSPNSWTRTVLSSGSGTYTTPTNCKAIRVRMIGAGGGGGGGGVSPSGGIGGTGGTTTFGTSLLTAAGGSGNGGGGYGPVNGGTASGGDINIAGQQSQPSFGAGGTSNVVQGPQGGNSPWFAGGGSGGWPGAPGFPGTPNTGGGGGGGGASVAGNSGAPGAGGGYCEKLIVNPSATYAYAVGAGTSGGIAGGGTSAAAGGAGGSGLIVVEEFY
jgi:hypothetical protein